MFNRVSIASALLAASVALAGCGAQPTQPVNMAFVEPGAAYDMQTPNGGKFSLKLVEATSARSVLAFSEDIKGYAGKLVHTASGKEIPFTLNDTQYGATGDKGETMVSFLNLVPGEWKLVDLVAYDRADKAVQQNVTGNVFTIKPYEVTYGSVKVQLKDNYLNENTGALQADVSSETGALVQNGTATTMWNEGSFPAGTELVSLNSAKFAGTFSAFDTSSTKGKWLGAVQFALTTTTTTTKFLGAKIGEETNTTLEAKLENDGSFTLAKDVKLKQGWLLLDSYSSTNASNFVLLPSLSANIDIKMYKAPQAEIIKTSTHPDGIRVQRYFYVENTTHAISSFYFIADGASADNGELIAVDFTDANKGDKPTGGNFKVVHIQALDK